MFIRLDNEGTVSIVEDGEATYQANAAEFASDAPDVVPAIPPGFRLVALETSTGVCTGYDEKGNAFPGIEWGNAADLHLRADALKQAGAARSAAAGQEQAPAVRPQEVTSDTQDIGQSTEVTVL